MEFSHITTNKFSFWNKNMLSIILVSAWLLHQTSKDKFFSDKFLFELIHPPNPKNYVIWAHAVSDNQLWSSSKFQPLERVWGMIFFGLKDLHKVLHKSNIEQVYYCTNILETNVFQILWKNTSEVSDLTLNLNQTCLC